MCGGVIPSSIILRNPPVAVHECMCVIVIVCLLSSRSLSRVQSNTGLRHRGGLWTPWGACSGGECVSLCYESYVYLPYWWILAAFDPATRNRNSRHTRNMPTSVVDAGPRRTGRGPEWGSRLYRGSQRSSNHSITGTHTTREAGGPRPTGRYTHVMLCYVISYWLSVRERLAKAAA